ncbi:DUF6538 domain-containing protein [Rhizobium mayense]|uniref:Tyrosine-type recombinase/integrase n=1 Tax=Rhizobium mayense TaxID=1312184 RepID=A0ABT7JWY1_9HYPH|nr:DUF6538 domain-containing protein [Rhizobium mayense]MDL2399439.1 tyrosine-type recombinase/integrase [Rhizobium mayense]
MARPIKRGSIYWLRKKVPDDLRPVIGKREEKFSLKTRDPAEAKVLFAKAAAEIEERWSRLRQGPITLTHKQVWGIAGDISRAWVSRFEDEPDKDEAIGMSLQLARIFEPAKTTVKTGGDPALVAKMLEAMNERTFGWLDAKIAAHLKEMGLLVDAQSLEKLRAATGKSLYQAKDQIWKFRKGDYSPNPIIDAYPSFEKYPEVPSETALPSSGVMLSTAISAWVKEKTRKDGDWVESSAESNELWARRFLELVSDKPLGEYKKADARKFKEAIMSLPPNFLQKEEFKKLDFLEAVEKAKSTDVDKMSNRNVNKILGFVRAFWNWAEAQYDDVPANPFNKMNLRLAMKARDERDPFTTSQLQKIFDAPLFTGCKSEKSYLTAGDYVPSDQGIYWVPLIGLFTGARSGEVIQLLCDDVRHENGILFFDIRDDGERSKADLKQGLKTDASVRTIPVHKTLKKLGFAEFVERQRKKGKRLFPDFPKAADGYYSTAYSPRFKRFLVDIGAKTDRNSFHSFRHSFEDCCRNSRIPIEFINALQGHSDGGMADRYGTGMVRVRLLKEEMDKLIYEGLDFSRLIAARKDLVAS